MARTDAKKKQRLAAALRENLKRRKTQSREVKSPKPAETEETRPA